MLREGGKTGSERANGEEERCVGDFPTWRVREKVRKREGKRKSVRVRGQGEVGGGKKRGGMEVRERIRGLEDFFWCVKGML